MTIFSASNIDTVILDQFKLDGKVALVTGASAGLGQAIAIALAEAGADVVCHGNTRTPDATLEAISRLGRQTLAVGGDLAKKETRGALVEATYGKGRWLYVGLGLWRQLAAGTDGAYQLTANLISLGKTAKPAASSALR